MDDELLLGFPERELSGSQAGLGGRRKGRGLEERVPDRGRQIPGLDLVATAQDHGMLDGGPELPHVSGPVPRHELLGRM